MPTKIRLSTRAIEPSTYDAETRSALSILATEDPIYSTDAQSGRAVLEVWRMDGMEPVDQVPLLDSHDREGVDCVLGSVTDIRVSGDKLQGRVTISATEQATAEKVGEGHIRDVSAGIAPIEAVIIRAGQTGSVGGQEYTAPDESDLRIVTRWRLKEVSLVPIGADPSAKIRSEFSKKEAPIMGPKMRAYLEGIGLPKDASEEEAKRFYDALPEQAQARADAYVVEISEEEEESEVESEGAMQPARADVETVEGEDKANVAGKPQRSAANAGSTRAARGVKAERERVKAIHELADGVPAETVRQAIDEGWTKEKFAMSALNHIRNRQAPVGAAQSTQRGFAIHSRSSDEATPEIIGLAVAMRQGLSGDKIFSARGSYVSEEKSGIGNFTYRKAYGESNDQDKRAKTLEIAERYSTMSMVDVCRMACAMDGKSVSYGSDPINMIRTAVSGSALASIFTTSFNATFMTGYLDFADTTSEWCHAEDVVNFMPRQLATMGKIGSLKKHSKGQTAEDVDIVDWREEYSISRFSGRFVVDEMDLINDRFSAIDATMPMELGLSAAQLRPNLVYSEVLNNAALGVDGINLFDASTHKNYGTTSTALDATSLQAAISSIAKQRIKNRVLNLVPRYLIVPQDLIWTAQTLIRSEQRIIAAASGGTYNPLLNLLGVIADDRMGLTGVVDPRTDTQVAGSATNWLLACRPMEGGAKTIMVGYLQGSGRAPRIRSFVLDKGQWGLAWDVSHDIGVKALDYRAMYFATGAGA